MEQTGLQYCCKEVDDLTIITKNAASIAITERKAQQEATGGQRSDFWRLRWGFPHSHAKTEEQ